MITILMRSGTSIHTNLTVKELEDRIFNCGLHAEHDRGCATLFTMHL